jgi:outer membrane protein
VIRKVSAVAFFTSSIGIGAAADLSASITSVSASFPEVFPRWFVRIGGLGVISQSSSTLYVQQQNLGIFGVGPQLLVPGRSQKYNDLLTINIQAGYFITRNLSVEAASGFPVWQTARITGNSATPPFAGAVLSTSLPAAIPITAVYHFTEFGALQPYVGVGVTPIFALTVRDGFAVGPSTDLSVGLVLQGGLDYMLNRNWGVFIDVKKYFDRSVSRSTGLNYGFPVGEILTVGSSVTNAQPWVLAAGLTYRF